MPESKPAPGDAAQLFTEKLAAGPISWGVCEVPGWGVQLPPDRVLAEMRGLGIRATEAGPQGYLGHDATSVAALLERHGLRLVGGFLPVVLHDPARLGDALAAARRTAALFAAAGGTMLVSAAVVDEAWSPRVPLDASQWHHLLTALARLDDVAGEAGLAHVLHPHVGTLVETEADLRRVLEGSSVTLCLDTGHLSVGGADPLALARDHRERIGHVHLKDVSADLARRVRAGELDLLAATRLGLFRPLGEGDVAVADVVRELEQSGYAGWYVLEQDVTLHDDQAREESGPRESVRRSIELLRTLGARRNVAAHAAEGR